MYHTQRTPLITSFATLVLLWTGSALAQTTAGGSIRGRVSDASGGAVGAAAVTLQSPNAAGIVTALSDSEGNYRLLEVPAASDYTITVEKIGFTRFERKGLTMRAGLNITLDISLQVGNLNQTVDVTAADTPLLDTVSAEQSVDISGELVRSLPLTGRREWSDTLQLTPGILSASTDAYGGQVYFVRGTENENHATLLDGADIGSFQQNWPVQFHQHQHRILGRRTSQNRGFRRVIAQRHGHGDQLGHSHRRRQLSWGALPALLASWLELQQHPRRTERRIGSRAAGFFAKRSTEEAPCLVLRIRQIYPPQ